MGARLLNLKVAWPPVELGNRLWLPGWGHFAREAYRPPPAEVILTLAGIRSSPPEAAPPCSVEVFGLASAILIDLSAGQLLHQLASVCAEARKDWLTKAHRHPSARVPSPEDLRLAEVILTDGTAPIGFEAVVDATFADLSLARIWFAVRVEREVLKFHDVVQDLEGQILQRLGRL